MLSTRGKPAVAIVGIKYDPPSLTAQTEPHAA
jgi:hypothetical protein